MRQIDELSEGQAAELTALFRDLWWTPGRTAADVRTMLRHSLVVAFEDEGGSLQAFARVLSDRVYKALILDVVVVTPQRGTGLGRRLMDAVLEDSRLEHVQHFELYCAPDMVPFYERWGFTSSLGTLTFMRVVSP